MPNRIRVDRVCSLCWWQRRNACGVGGVHDEDVWVQIHKEHVVRHRKLVARSMRQMLTNAAPLLKQETPYFHQ